MREAAPEAGTNRTHFAPFAIERVNAAFAEIRSSRFKTSIP
jgi:hypothetical protein